MVSSSSLVERRNGQTPPGIFDADKFVKPITYQPEGEVCWPSKYSDKLQRLQGTPLANLHARLMTPFQESGAQIKLNQVEVGVLPMDGAKSKEANQIVNVSYNLHYVEDHGQIVEIAELDDSDQSQIVVATQNINGENLLLATFRVDFGGHFDVFDLFEPLPGCHWPHEEGPDLRKPGVLQRFSYTPFIDSMANHSNDEVRHLAKFYQYQLLRMMWPIGIKCLTDHGVSQPYFILADHVYRHVLRSGINPGEPVPGIRDSDSEYSQTIRKRFSGYWDLKPKVFEAPLEAEEPRLRDTRVRVSVMV